ncbi:MAG: hypothetical protein F6K65_39035 [Moorea sp. SIO3C2]|nr:hypothetical protein [Moorena sp. SIO3C2]
MDYPIRAREGNPYTTLEWKQVTISEIINKLSAPDTQVDALQVLGIRFNHKILDIKFIETGNAYADPDGDRTKIEDVSTKIVDVELILDNQPRQPLTIESSLEPFIEDGVNFFGSITCKTPNGETIKIPMIGRGTVALDGRANDAHAGFCVGGACASFQERTAIVLAVAAAAGAKDEQIDLIGEKLGDINDRYHGRRDILTYSLECAKRSQMPSYTEYMKARYPEGERSPLLQSVINTGKPNQAYYEKALQKMTPEELAEDREAAKASYKSYC